MTSSVMTKSQSLSDWLSYLEHIHPQQIDMGLTRVRQVAERADLLSLPSFVITVGGTNGKGTTCAMLSSILNEAGYTTGVITSYSIHYTKLYDARPLRLIMDVWEKEPDILQSLVPLTEIATPHIAGYSLDGRYRGTYMLYEQFCDIFNFEKTIAFSSLLPVANINQICVAGILNEALLKQMIHLVYDA